MDSLIELIWPWVCVLYVFQLSVMDGVRTEAPAWLQTHASANKALPGRDVKQVRVCDRVLVWTRLTNVRRDVKETRRELIGASRRIGT